jgi:hypothetical protein
VKSNNESALRLLITIVATESSHHSVQASNLACKGTFTT